jgi:hypothetical protein
MRKPIRSSDIGRNTPLSNLLSIRSKRLLHIWFAGTGDKKNKKNENVGATTEIPIPGNLDSNIVSEPLPDLVESVDVLAAVHCWSDFDQETGVHLDLPVFNKAYKMSSDSIYFFGQAWSAIMSHDGRKC